MISFIGYGQLPENIDDSPDDKSELENNVSEESLTKQILAHICCVPLYLLYLFTYCCGSCVYNNYKQSYEEVCGIKADCCCTKNEDITPVHTNEIILNGESDINEIAVVGDSIN